MKTNRINVLLNIILIILMLVYIHFQIKSIEVREQLKISNDKLYEETRKTNDLLIEWNAMLEK